MSLRTRLCVCVNACTHTHTHAHTCTHAHARAHAHARTRTHTRVLFIQGHSSWCACVGHCPDSPQRFTQPSVSRFPEVTTSTKCEQMNCYPIIVWNFNPAHPPRQSVHNNVENHPNDHVYVCVCFLFFSVVGKRGLSLSHSLCCAGMIQWKDMGLVPVLGVLMEHIRVAWFCGSAPEQIRTCSQRGSGLHPAFIHVSHITLDLSLC